MRGPVALLCGAALCCSLAACGVRAQDEPEAVPARQLPSYAAGPSTADLPADAVTYLVERGRLVPERMPAATPGSVDALRTLLALSGPQGERRSAIPAGTQLRSVRRNGDLVLVELGERFLEVRGRDQILASGQVVYTLTEQPPARRVQILVGGQPVPIPRQDGTSTEPVTRDAFAGLRLG